MKIVIADTGALISLGLVDQIGFIQEIFGEFYMAQAVWEELNNYENPEFDRQILEPLEQSPAP